MPASPRACSMRGSAPGWARPSRGESSACSARPGGRYLRRLLLIASIVAAGAAHVAPAQQPKPAQIDRNGVLILVRSTLLALDHANKTGNYTVLRDLAAPAFQVNTAARLAEIFAGHRREGLDLSGVIVIDLQFSLLLHIETNG